MEISIVLLGSAGVGKSAVTIQFVHGHFVGAYDPTIEENHRKQITVDDETFVMDIMDTAGCEEYDELRNIYIKRGDGFLLVYSIIDKKSFDEINVFHQRIVDVQDEAAPIVIVGNKSDLDPLRQIKKEDAISLSEEWGCRFMECSAKENKNVREAFIQLGNAAFEKKKKIVAEKKANSGDKKKKSVCILL